MVTDGAVVLYQRQEHCLEEAWWWYALKMVTMPSRNVCTRQKWMNWWRVVFSAYLWEAVVIVDAVGDFSAPVYWLGHFFLSFYMSSDFNSQMLSYL